MAERTALGIFRQLTAGVRDIHRAGIVHCDIKYLNILVVDYGDSSEGSTRVPTVKITDFGVAVKLDASQKSFTRRCGTVGFMAPELSLEKPADFKADIWSLGVVLYALICSSPPFVGQNDNETIEKSLADEPSFQEDGWDGVSQSCKDLVVSMLNKDQL